MSNSIYSDLNYLFMEECINNKLVTVGSINEGDSIDEEGSEKSNSTIYRNMNHLENDIADKVKDAYRKKV